MEPVIGACAILAVLGWLRHRCQDLANQRAAQRSRLWAVLLIGAATVGLLAPASSAAAAPPVCGSIPEGSDAPATATVEAPAGEDLSLGRSNSGERHKELEFTFSGDCIPPRNVPVRLSPFAGTDKDLESGAIKASKPVVDGSTIRVTLTVVRECVGPGEYTGTVTVGNSQIGSAKTDLTIKRQEPFWPWPLLLGAAAAVGGIALAGLQSIQKGSMKPTVSIERMQESSGLQQRFWRLVQPIERVGRLLKMFLTSSHGWAALLGLGAAASAFNATYVSDPTWSLTLSAGFALIAAVGGGALAASFAAWLAPHMRDNDDDNAQP